MRLGEAAANRVRRTVLAGPYEALGRLARKIADPPRLLKKRYPAFEIGRGSSGDLIVHRGAGGGRLTMGAWCSVGPEVQLILGETCPVDRVSTRDFGAAPAGDAPEDGAGVVIGHGVVIGAEAMILAGVTIGEGARIAPRALVTCDVPPYAVAIGDPLAIHARYDDATVAALVESRWWSWSPRRARRAVQAIQSGDVSWLGRER